jgi:dipeptidyl aminopeptidase/acylaminoacyl peptidase
MLHWVPTYGGGQAEPMTAPGHVDFPSDWSSDGRQLAFARANPDLALPSNWDVLVWDRETRQASFIERTAFNESNRFSPDGHWLAYV